MTQVWRNPRLAGRIPELDGLRGLAILLVLIQHFVCDAVHLNRVDWRAHYLVPFRLAWSGVDLFFVLSGFLIGGILIDARWSKEYYSTFYARRFYRIIPLYYLWLFVFIIGRNLSAHVQTGFLVPLFQRHLPTLAYFCFVQNGWMSLRNTIGPIWLGATWSLAVEEQFYLILPLIVRHSRIRTLAIVTGLAIVFAPVLRFFLMKQLHSSLPSYTLLPCRADALGFGVLVAILVRDRAGWEWLVSHRRGLYILFLFLGLGVSSLLFVKLPFENPFFVGFGFSLLAAFYTGLLVLLVIPAGRAEKKVFTWGPLMNLGTVAYAVYIMHAGINYLWHGILLGKVPAFDSRSGVIVTILALGTVLILASISWRIFESPLIRHAYNRFRYAENGRS